MTTPKLTSKTNTLVLWTPPQTPEELLRSEIEKRTNEAYRHALELEKAAPLTGISRAALRLRNLKQNGMIGTSVLIARGNLPLVSVQSDTISLDTQFMIGSVSKQFFAVALLKALYTQAEGLTEEERVNQVKIMLQKPLSHFLSHGSLIWNAGSPPEWADKISLHQLLTHTSGIPDYLRISKTTPDWNQTGKQFHEFAQSTYEILKLISKEDWNKPGKQWQYSNTNYRIIADVIEAITEQPASIYIEEQLFNSIGMTSTGNPTRGKSTELKRTEKFAQLAREIQYDPIDRKTRSPDIYEDIGVANGDGSIISTPRDLLKWNVALHSNQKVLPDGLYQLLTANHAKTDHETGYGYGIEKDSEGTLLHFGGISSYRSMLQYLPRQGTSIIVLSCAEPYASEKFFRLLNEKLSELEKMDPELNSDSRELKADQILTEEYPDDFGQIHHILSEDLTKH